MDHVGLLNLLPAIVPLLSNNCGSVLYTENLLQGAKESQKVLETLLHSNVTTSSLLFGVAPVGYLLGTMTDSTHIERLLDVSARSVTGRQKQYRMRIPWKRPLHGGRMLSDITPALYRLNMDPYELASLFKQTYLAMFREAEDIRIRMEVMKRKMTHFLASDLNYYSRLSLVTLLTSARRTISTDWQECIRALVDMIENDRTLIVGSNSLQELYMLLHLSGLWYSPMLEENPRKYTVYYGSPRPAGEPGVLGKVKLPGTVQIALVVPRSSLAVFTDQPVNQVGTPGLQLHVRNQAFDNAFFAVDIFFGRFESDEIDSASFVEDVLGWSGTSDMIITCRVPTWGLLIGGRQDIRVELVVTTSPATSSYTMKLGVRNVVFGTSLDSKNVRILIQAPSVKPSVTSGIELVSTPEPTEPGTTAMALQHDGSVQSFQITNKFTLGSKEGKALKDGGSVEVKQISPLILAVSIGKLQNASRFIFPFPVDGTACKTRISRKSLWIEIKAPPSNALQPGGFDIDPFPVVGQGTSSLAWSMGRVDCNLQPKVKVSASTPRFLKPLSSMALSQRERTDISTNQSSDKTSPMVQLKGSICQMLSACAGDHPDVPGNPVQLLALKHDGDYKFFIVAETLRHDRDTGSVFLDAFFMAANADSIKHKSLEMIAGKNAQHCLVINTSERELVLWRYLIPALVERCRSWEHATNCKYKTNPAMSFICDCGVGTNAGSMPSEYKHVAAFSTRIAIPLISAVPYVESMIDETTVAKMTAAFDAADLGEENGKAGNASCDHCGSDKLGLKACSRCEKVKYCNHACQKAAWKTHKKVCKR